MTANLTQTYSRAAKNRHVEPGATDLAAASPLVKSPLLPGGAYITNTFDSGARLTGTFLKNSQHSTLNSHQYSYNLANQRTQQVFTAGNYMDYTYDDIGQLKTATGRETGGTSIRPHEKLGYSYDAAGNLNWRTNNALQQNFGVNSLNELTTVSRQGNLTVAGGVSTTATSVTLKDNANLAQAATVYGDNTFAWRDIPLAGGSDLHSRPATLKGVLTVGR